MGNATSKKQDEFECRFDSCIHLGQDETMPMKMSYLEARKAFSRALNTINNDFNTSVEEDIFNRSTIVYAKAGDTVLNAGVVGRVIFFVLSGTIEQRKDDIVDDMDEKSIKHYIKSQASALLDDYQEEFSLAGGNTLFNMLSSRFGAGKNATLKRKSGQVVGAHSALFNRPQAWTAVAKTNSIMLGLHVSLYQSILAKSQEEWQVSQILENRGQVLESINGFQFLSDDGIKWLTESSEFLTFQCGEKLVASGEAIHGIYIILRGTAVYVSEFAPKVNDLKHEQYPMHQARWFNSGDVISSLLAASEVPKAGLQVEYDIVVGGPETLQVLYVPTSILEKLDLLDNTAYGKLHWSYFKAVCKSTSLFSLFDTEQVAVLREISHVLSFESGDIILNHTFKEEQLVVYIILHGAVKAEEMSSQSDASRGAVLLERDFFGDEIFLVNPEAPRELKYVAAGHVVCAVFTGKDLRKNGLLDKFQRSPEESKYGEPKKRRPESFMKLASLLASNETSFYRDSLAKKNSLDDQLQVVKLLHSTKCSQVHLALHVPTQQLCAVKSVNVRVAASHGMQIYVRNERNILAVLSSPFVVKLLGAWEEKPLFSVLALDPVLCGDLESWIKRPEEFSFQQCLFFAAIATSALKYIHEQSVCHRDIKSANFLLDHDGYFKLTDFGISKRLDNPSSRTCTFIGSPRYMAPEVAALLGGTSRNYGLGVDWWSLGITLFEMVKKTTPFTSPINKDTEELSAISNFAARFQAEIPLEDPRLQSLTVKSIHFTTDEWDSYVSFIVNLLQPKEANRLGCQGAREVIEHPLFRDMDFEILHKKQILSPFDVSETDFLVDIQNLTSQPKNKKRSSVRNALRDSMNSSSPPPSLEESTRQHLEMHLVPNSTSSKQEYMHVQSVVRNYRAIHTSGFKYPSEAIAFSKKTLEESFI